MPIDVCCDKTLRMNMYYLDLLKKMLSDMETAPTIYQPTNFWKALIPPIVKDIEQYGFENFKRTPSSNEYWVGIEIPALAVQHYVTFLYHDNDKMPPHIQQFSEDMTGQHPMPLNFFEKVYSPSSLSYLKGLVYLKKHVDTSMIKNVLEIGGGYGVLGEILLKAKPEDIFYVDIDIPPVSAIATYYLQTIFGKEAILDYNQSIEMETLDIDEIRKHYRGMVLCPWQLPKLRGQFELSVNFVSFQEMEPDVVKNYADYVNVLTSRYLLLRNSKTGKQIAHQPNEYGVIKPTVREDYLDFFSPFKLVALDCKTFGYIYPSGFESEVMVMQKKDC